MLALLFAVLCGFVPKAQPAQAAQGSVLELGVSAAYTSVAFEQYIDITLTVVNKSDSLPVTNITASYLGDPLYNLPRLEAGSTDSMTTKVYFTLSQLDIAQPIVFFWYQGDQQYSGTATFFLHTYMPEGDRVVINRYISAEQVLYGTVLSISYSIENPNPWPLRSLMVTDQSLGVVGQLESLAAGERWDFQQNITAFEPVLTLPSVVAISKNGLVTAQAAATSVGVIQPKLSNTLSIRPLTQGESDQQGNARLVGSVQNVGDCDLTQLSLHSPEYGLIGEFEGFNRGQQRSVDFVFDIGDKQGITIMASGLTPDGQPIEFAVWESLFADALSEDAQALEMEVRCERTTLRGAGEVTFTVILKNKGLLPIEELELVLDEDSGQRRSLTPMKAGETREYGYTLPVLQTREFFIQAIYQGRGNTPVRIAAPAVRITVLNIVGDSFETEELFPQWLIMGWMTKLREVIRQMGVAIIGLLALMLLTVAMHAFGYFERDPIARARRVQARAQKRKQREAAK